MENREGSSFQHFLSLRPATLLIFNPLQPGFQLDRRLMWGGAFGCGMLVLASSLIRYAA